MKQYLIILFLLFIIVPLCAGPLVLVGGGLKDDNSNVYNLIIKSAGKNPVIGIITAASRPESKDSNTGTDNANNSKANGEYYRKNFKKYGARSIWLPIDIDNISENSTPQTLSIINKCTGFFFGGGNQSRLLKCFRHKNGQNSKALEAILEKHRTDNAVIAGTSAGTAISGKRVMISGGESYNALVKGAFLDGQEEERYDLTYNSSGGFGFFDPGVIDTHFSARGRQGRIIRLAWDTQHKFAFGVDENTALYVNQGKMKVLGENGVFIFDLSKAIPSDKKPWCLYNVNVNYLTSGDRFIMSSGKFIPGKGKIPITGNEQYDYYKTYSNNIFTSVNNYDEQNHCRRDPREFVKVTRAFLNSRYTYSAVGLTYEKKNRFGIRMRKENGTKAFFNKSTSKIRDISYHDLFIDIIPVK